MFLSLHHIHMSYATALQRNVPPLHITQICNSHCIIRVNPDMHIRLMPAKGLESKKNCQKFQTIMESSASSGEQQPPVLHCLYVRPLPAGDASVVTSESGSPCEMGLKLDSNLSIHQTMSRLHDSGAEHRASKMLKAPLRTSVFFHCQTNGRRVCRAKHQGNWPPEVQPPPLIHE